MTRELAERLHAPAVLARFSRLLADANRPEDSPTLFRDTAEGLSIEMNTGIGPDERQRRIEQLYRPYHAAVDAAAAASAARWMFSVHTFTPLYEGNPRTLELGILFDTEEEAARSLGARCAEAGFEVDYNEPYSGREGLIYSVERHALKHGKRPLEIELRNDLAEDPAKRRLLVEALADWFVEHQDGAL